MARTVHPAEDEWRLEPTKTEALPVRPLSMDEARRQGRGMRILANVVNTMAGLALIGNAAMVVLPSEEPIPAVWAVGGWVFVGGVTLDIAGRTKAKRAMLSVGQSRNLLDNSSLSAAGPGAGPAQRD